MKTIKKLSTITVVAMLGFGVSSCLNTDDNNNFSVDGYLNGTEINVNNDSINPVGQVTNVHITYKTTNSCQEFIAFRLLNNTNDTIHTIGVYGRQTNMNGACLDEVKTFTKTYKFTPKKAGKNKIRVLAGIDPTDNTKNIYIEKTLDIKN